MIGKNNVGGSSKEVFPISISITTAPTKTSYKAGETFSSSGMVIKATFSDDSVREITSECTFSPSTKLYENNTEITVSWIYNGLSAPLTYTTTQAITVTRVLSSIAITTKPTTTYKINSTFSTSGMVITATFTSGNTAVVTGWSTSPANGATLTASTSTTLTVSYTENGVTKTTSTTLTINYNKYTVKIDTSNSNPSSCCTYADDAAGMTKGSSAWDDIFGYKPCVMYNGSVQGYLNPSNFAYYTSGSSAPITTVGYDVMIEFPRRGLNISTSGNIITITLTDNPNDSSFGYYAHKRGSTSKNYFYYGAYAAYISRSKVYSSSDKTPTRSTTLTNFISYAQSRGSGYEIIGFYQWTYILALYVLKYGNLNSQAALGQGYTGGSSAQTTGVCNTKGMNYGNTSSSTDRVKLFGIEDMWGNIWQWMCGLYCVGSTCYTTTNNFGTNTSSSYWENTSISTPTYNNSGYITKIQGTTLGGFIPQGFSGSTTTYFSDYGLLHFGYFPNVGGHWNDGAYAGVFCCYVPYSVSASDSRIGSRLMYL